MTRCSKSGSLAWPPRSAIAIHRYDAVGRSYGRGVLELEPSEAEELPYPTRISSRTGVEKADRLVRAGDIHAAPDLVDRSVLADKVGLGAEETEEIDAARRIWTRLRDRRVGRRGARTSA